MTGIGLLRLRNWARISIIVFSVLQVGTGVFGGLGSLAFFMVSIPNSNVDPSALALVRIIMVAVALTQLGIGIWWLVFFNRARVKAQFVPRAPMFPGVLPPMPYVTPPPPPLAATRTGPMPPDRPLSVTIIAWYLLLTCMLIPLNLLLRAPATLFVAILTGWSATLYYAMFAAVQVYVGIGLLRLQPAARLVGVAYFIFAFLNSVVFFLAPGAHARLVRLMELQLSIFPWMRTWQNMSPVQFDITPFIAIGAVGGLVFLLIPMYFLFASKQAFAKTAGVATV
jgi:hypothetical protein